MPHGGIIALRALAAALVDVGISESTNSADADWPEAADDLEAAMLRALARTPSPLALDLLLDQPRRWKERAQSPDAEAPEAIAARSRVLNRLLDPPLVVAVGPPNIGKSTLANHLAGRHVAIVADEPGTTRDHVGVTLVLDGLAVRWIDTPGLRKGDDEEAGAREIAMSLAARADLMVECEDVSAALPDGQRRPGALRVGIRADLGPPGSRTHINVSAARSWGVSELALMVRARLLPPDLLRAPGPWRFWNESSGRATPTVR